MVSQSAVAVGAGVVLAVESVVAGESVAILGPCILNPQNTALLWGGFIIIQMLGPGTKTFPK